MRFTDAEISAQEEFVQVLRYKHEKLFYEAMEARRLVDEVLLSLNTAKAKLERMLQTR